jgi:sugar lactone lactonase YvrE
MNWNRYGGSEGAPRVAAGWTVATVMGPSVLFGANGMKVGPDGELYVAQAFGSQISALDPETGAARTICAPGGEIVAPDDLAFDSNGTLYVTEVMSERVSARLPDGSVRVIADGVPVANGITTYDDRIFMDEFRIGGRLFELYPDGRAPRLIADNLTLPNALAMGPDGYLYYPQVVNGEIWRVSPAGGTPERVIAGLALPTAVKFSPKGALYTVQAGSGEIARVDPQRQTWTRVARVRPGIDNLAFAPNGRLFVSHFVDGGVAEIEVNGQERVLVPPGLLGPFGLCAASDGTIYVADGMSLVVRGRDGRITARPALVVNHDFPGFVRGIAVATDGTLHLTNSAGDVVAFKPGRDVETLASDLDELMGISLTPDGTVAVCAAGSGEVLLIARGRAPEVLAHGLARPVGVACGQDGTCYVTESTRGRVLELRNGDINPVLEGLREPHGIVLDGDDLYVLDRAAQQLFLYSLSTRRLMTIASDLPVGSAGDIAPRTLPGIRDLMPGPLSPFAALARAPDGSVLIGADGAGAILAVRRDGADAVPHRI